MGEEFVGRTQVLRVSITDEQLDAVVGRITELGSLYIPGSGLEALKRITGRERTSAAISFDGSNVDNESLRETFDEANEGGLFDTSDSETQYPNPADKPKFNLADGTNYKVSGNSTEPGRTTMFSKRLEQVMARLTGDAVAPGTYQEVSTPASQANTVRAIERIFGRRVVWFKKAKDFPFNFNGVMIPSDPKTLYVNINSKNPFAGVVGHELLHAIRKTHPDVYKKLAQIAMKRLKADGFARFSREEDARI